ncbi:MAG: uroporphyrinogen decarboxylase family protein [Clostridiales Family XIII bacterium]|jgi:uroporphyrinogen decarboxylase|nr:uroporphyrinogen decarboxylase family protein [Clostridiales Family XIII bacterium]
MKPDFTPKQRLKALAEGRPIDRIPSDFGIGQVALRYLGVDMKKYAEDLNYKIDSDIAVYREYNTEKLMAMFSVPELYGAKRVTPKTGHGYVLETEPPTREELRRPYIVDPKTDSRIKPVFDYAEGILEKVGDEIPLGIFMEGTITQAGRIIGTERLLRLLLKDPEYVFALLDSILGTQTALVEAFAGCDVSFGIMDPVSSGVVISDSHYRTFSKPYQKALFSVMTRVSGQKPTVHICGNTTKILRDVAETGAASFSVDNMMDLELVKREIGDLIPIAGNVKPTETMLLGTPDDVDRDLRQCFRKAWDTPAGYIPAFGCGLPMETPKENVEQLLVSLEKYAKWPLDPANFS